jgi:hypothetical protein
MMRMLLRMFATSNVDPGLVRCIDLHKAMDEALQSGWQPKIEADTAQPPICRPPGSHRPNSSGLRL